MLQVFRLRGQPVKAQEVPDHIRPSFNTASSLQVCFMQSKFRAYQASLFPSHVSPFHSSSLSFFLSFPLLPSASREPQCTHVSCGMPFPHSKPRVFTWLKQTKHSTALLTESSGPATLWICFPLVGKFPLSLNFWVPKNE